MRSELTKILHRLILENQIPPKDLAKAVGKPYSTLLREINPYDAGAKLGIETLMQIMRITKNVTPLEYMASQLGYKITVDSSPVADDADLFENINNQTM